MPLGNTSSILWAVSSFCAWALPSVTPGSVPKCCLMGGKEMTDFQNHHGTIKHKFFLNLKKIKFLVRKYFLRHFGQTCLRKIVLDKGYFAVRKYEKGHRGSVV